MANPVNLKKRLIRNIVLLPLLPLAGLTVTAITLVLTGLAEQQQTDAFTALMLFGFWVFGGLGVWAIMVIADLYRYRSHRNFFLINLAVLCAPVPLYFLCMMILNFFDGR